MQHVRFPCVPTSPSVLIPESVAASGEDKREALSHRREINDNVDALLKHIDSGSLIDAKRYVLSIRDNTKGLEQYLSTTIEPKYYTEHRTPNSVIATKVFAIPELFESILENLEIMDLINCYSVCRMFRDSLEHSTKLQTLLFLRPNPTSEVLACRVPDSTSSKRFELMVDSRMPHRVDAHIGRWGGSRDPLPKIGSRWRRMLVGQPPVLSMRYGNPACYPSDPDTEGCEIERFPDGFDYALLTSDEGLTIGDLYDKAEMLFKLHLTCGRGNLFMSFDGVVPEEEA